MGQNWQCWIISSYTNALYCFISLWMDVSSTIVPLLNFLFGHSNLSGNSLDTVACLSHIFWFPISHDCLKASPMTLKFTQGKHIPLARLFTYSEAKWKIPPGYTGDQAWRLESWLTEEPVSTQINCELSIDAIVLFPPTVWGTKQFCICCIVSAVWVVCKSMCLKTRNWGSLSHKHLWCVLSLSHSLTFDI